MVELSEFMKTVVKFSLILFYIVKYSFFLALYYIYTLFEKRTKERLNVPKCLTDFQVGSHVILPVKGVKIHYMDVGDKSKPLLVFLHGFPEFWYSWRHQLKEFAKDYWCVAVDLRGYGYSDKPEGLSSYKIDVIVEEIKDLVQILGKDKFTIIGHDWGSLLAAAFVDRYGDMLDKYVLMSAPSADIFYNLIWSEYKQFRNSWYTFLFTAPFLPERIIQMNDFEMLDKAFGDGKSEFVTKDDIEAYKYTFSKPGALTYPLKYYQREILFPTFKEIQKPIKDDLKGLFILGEKDRYISSGCIPLMKKKYKELTVELLKDCRHFIQQENPVEVNNLLREFFAK